MDQVDPLRHEPLLVPAPRHRWWLAPAALMAVSVILLVAVLVANLQRPEIALTVLIALALSIGIFILLLTRLSRQLHREQRETASALQTSESEFQQMAGNIQEIFWSIDVQEKKVLYINQAYEAITGRSCQSLIESPSSYEEVIHPDDRGHIFKNLEEAAHTGHFDERFRITTPEGDVRWVWVRGFPVRDADGRIMRLVGTALEITAQKQAEEQVAANLTMAKSAWAEEEALRKATLSLTQDLHMDNVMGALLRSLAEVVPYTCARVFV